MKRILTIIFLLVLNFSLKAQIPQEPNTYGYNFKRVGADSLLWIPKDTLQVPSWGVGKTHIARKGTTLYYWDGTKWSAISGSGGTYTAGNGLTLSGSQFKLGGPLTENTTITGDATNKLVLQGYNASNDGYLNIGQDAGYLQFGSASFTPSYESEIYSGNIELGLRTSGNIYLDARDIYTIGVPTVSSTTGRKVALIDTATGKVERIDPASLVSTPTLQQVMDAGSEALVNNEIIISSLTDPVSINSVQQLALSGVSGSVQSTVTVFTDSIFIMPHLGQLNIDSLRTWSGISDTTYKKPMTWDTRNGRWEYAANWYVTTPTLQQVLTAGSTLTTDNIIDANNTDFDITNAANVTISGDGTGNVSFVVNQSGMDISTGITQIFGYTNNNLFSQIDVISDSILFAPHKGQISIDSLRTWSGISDTTHKKPMTWDTRNGRWEYAANWYAPVTESNTVTLTNKRWTARVGSTTSSATPTINTDNYDIYKLTAQTADITSFTTNLSGTPNDGDILEIQITGTAARAITWGSSFVSTTVTLPTTTTSTNTLTVILQYYTTSSYGNNKWHCVNYY